MKPQPILVSDLIARIGADTQKRVEFVTKTQKSKIFDAVQDEMRFTLRRRGSSATSRISVDVSIGYPEYVGRIEVPEHYRLAALLQLYLNFLIAFDFAAGHIRDMVEDVGKAFPDAIDWTRLDHALNLSKTDVGKLRGLASIEKYDLVRQVLAVNRNVLGHYVFDPNNGDHGSRGCTGVIRLYWGVIGLVARAESLEVEDLTAVVLAHEYGHALSHLGFDITGHRWSGVDFARTDDDLAAGLAQYYALRALERLEPQASGSLAAYERLLRKQRDEYRAHEKWLECADSERIRSALTRVRRKGAGQYQAFNAELGCD